MNPAEVRELQIVSFHEAAHAAAHVELDLPLYEATVGVRRRWFRGPEGYGKVLFARGGRPIEIQNVGAYILAAIAGPEAEARTIHRLDGGSLDAARQFAYSYSRDGDFEHVAEQMDDETPFTLDDAVKEAQELVEGLWERIEAVAAELRERGRLSAREIRRAAA